MPRWRTRARESGAWRAAELWRDASAVQADAAEPFFTLDEDDFLAKVGSIKSGRVSAGAGTENDDFS